MLANINPILAEVMCTDDCLQDLENQNWIDQQTAVLFVEFTLFNPNISTFVSCLFLIEILPSGNIHLNSPQFVPISIYDTSNIWLCFICF
jgi:hypothetical protein